MPAAGERPLRVCYFGTYRANYSRNQMMIAGLRMNGVDVVECHQALWQGIDDRVRIVSGEWKAPAFWMRVVGAYWKLLRKYLQVGRYDVLVVGYPGPLDVYLARIMAWLKRKPLVWDVFMSVYLISLERGLDNKSRLSTRLLRAVEGLALKLPNRLIIDTSDYAKWFSKIYGINPARFRLVPTGADDRIFYPGTGKVEHDGKFCVLYSGTFIPNHGVMYIAEAARALIGEPEIYFEFIGTGPDLTAAQNFVQQNRLVNVQFIDWMEKEQLKQHMDRADVCLGAFGTTPQSLMTVQNKIYETMAMRRPLVSGDSESIRRAFKHGEQIYLCKRADGQSLADAIVTLWKDPALRENIAENGYKLYKEEYDLVHNGKRFRAFLEELRR